MFVETPPAVVVGNPISHETVSRIRTAYLHATKSFAGCGDSMWASIQGLSQDIHDLLVGADEDALARALSDPGSTNLFYGMDNMYRECTNAVKQASQDQLRVIATHNWHLLVQLAEAIGFRKMRNIEAPASPFTPSLSYDVEGILNGLDIALGETPPVRFPNPFGGEVGLSSSRGVISERATNAIYQACRLKSLSRMYGCHVLEIGAGLGRTAYYGNLFGLKPYSIIDLPLTNVAQALFLGAVIDNHKLRLSNDQRADSQEIEILDVSAVQEFPSVDIVLNADSLTEMERTTAEMYIDFMIKKSKVFFSINHESNSFRVSDIGDLANYRVSRYPYWLRAGYVEEVYIF